MKPKPKPPTRNKRHQYNGVVYEIGVDTSDEDDPRTDGECLNDNCNCTFCPEHSEVDIWAGTEFVAMETF